MAEALFRKCLAARLGCSLDELEDRGFLVMSAGIAAMMGSRAAAEAHAVMMEHDLDLRAHESQPLTDALVRNADLLITMTRSHRHAIVAEWPDAAAFRKEAFDWSWRKRGKDHWRTVDARVALEQSRKLSHLSADQRTRWKEAARLTAEVGRFS